MSKKRRKPLNPYIRFTAIAFQMGLTIYLGNVFGLWLDKKYTLTFWENTLTLIAVFIAIYSVIIQVINFTKHQK